MSETGNYRLLGQLVTEYGEVADRSGVGERLKVVYVVARLNGGKFYLRYKTNSSCLRVTERFILPQIMFLNRLYYRISFISAGLSICYFFIDNAKSE